MPTLLVLNAGSSSLKFSLFRAEGPEPEELLRGQFDGLFTTPRWRIADFQGTTLLEKTWPDQPISHEIALEHLWAWLRDQGRDSLAGVGHRVVHGGIEFDKPVRVDDQVLDRLERLIPLAPLHQPHNLLAMRILAQTHPALPQVACFDTSFHRTLPEVAQVFALPEEYRKEGLQRYGFHGLSYESIASRLGQTDEAAARGRTIVAHLGNGASLCALKAGRSIATTMGFTPLDGLPMGTRVGAIDPGVLLYLMDRYDLNARGLEKLLYHQSGLLGLSGISSDMRTLLASDRPEARLAVDFFVYRIVREIGSLAAALEGLDALVFTGGIGENSPEIRARVSQACRWLGVDLDPEANRTRQERINLPTSRVAVWVLPTLEELVIARHTRNLLPP